MQKQDKQHDPSKGAWNHHRHRIFLSEMQKILVAPNQKRQNHPPKMLFSL